MFATLNYGITGKALTKGFLELRYWNPRDFVANEMNGAYKHRIVDDRPYGGGPGMVMMVQPLRDAIHAAKRVLNGQASVVHLSPQGKRIDQQHIIEQAEKKELILIASRYEGVDERLIETEVDEEWSIGDYVISGGELSAMVVVDAIARLIPGVLGDPESAKQDSFMDGLLDCPHYTRPEAYQGRHVPNVLLKGNHQVIANWRLKQALGRTWLKRPDLLVKKILSPLEKRLLNEFICEYHEARGKTHVQ